MGPIQGRVALLLTAVISVNASYTVLIPFVPELEERVGAGPTAIALTFALFAAAKAIFQPLGGWWVDRWRADAVAFISLNIAAAGIVLTAVAGDVFTLLAGRVLWGVGEGLVSPALYAGMSALCRHYGVSSNRMMGNFGSAAVAGFLLGPLIAGIAAPVGLETLFIIGALATSLTAFGLLRAIPSPAPTEHPVAEPVTEETTGTTSGTATGEVPAGRWWLWVVLLGGLDLFTHVIYAALEPVLPLYLGSEMGGSARTAISVVFTVGLATSGLTMWLLGRYAERLRLATLIKTGLAFLVVGLVGFALSAELLSVAGSFLVFMVGYAVLFLTARRGIVELRAAAHHQGKAFGVFGLISDVGSVIGPIVGVVLYELSGRTAFLLLGAMSGLLLACMVVATGRLVGRGRNTTGEPSTRKRSDQSHDHHVPTV